MAVGFAAAELLGDLDPQWVVKTAAILLVVAGVFVFAIGFLGYRRTFRKIQERGVAGIPPWVVGGVTFAMILAALLLLFGTLTE